MVTLSNGEQICTTRKELAEKYFHLPFYEKGNMGMISLLSDVQHVVSYLEIDEEHYRQILNDIKSILSQDERDLKGKKADEF